jgi:hypothetical protein
MTTELDTTTIQQEGSELVRRAEAFQLVSAADYEAAAVEKRCVKTIKKKIEDFIAPIRDPAHEAWKAAKALENKLLQWPDKADLIWENKMRVWSMQAERDRRQEEARIREQLRREEEDRRLEEAAQLEKLAQAEAASGNKAVAVEMMKSAETLITEPVYAPPIVLPAATPKVDGVSQRTDWKWRAVQPELIPREYLLIDEVKIGKVVRALRESTSIPGIEAYPVQVMSTRSY